MIMRRSAPRPISAITAAIFAVALAALFLIALFPLFPNQSDVRVGDRVSRVVRSPRTFSFESAFLTEQQRQAAADAVPQSLVFDPDVRERKLTEYDRITAQMSDDRGLTDDARKRAALASLELSQRGVETAILLSDDRWSAVAVEGRRVLSETLGVSLNETGVADEKDGVDSDVSPAFGADEALLTAELVRPLIVPTLVVDQERTEQERASARARVGPEIVSVEQGDTIVAADSQIGQVEIEKLRIAGLLSSTVEWRNVVAVALVAAVAALAIAGYVFFLQPAGITQDRHLIALAVIAALPLAAAKFHLPIVLPDDERQFLAYLLPLATAPILIAALLNTEVAVLVSLITGMMIALVSALLPDVSLVAPVTPLEEFRLLIAYGLGPVAGVYLVHRADRLNRYLTAGIAVGVFTYVLLLSTWFIDNDRQFADLGWMAGITAVNGIASGMLAAGAFVSAGVLLGVTTRVQLMELSQLNSPLLRRLQDEAPGTFHHSVIVGNLAERAADLIGADPLLARVGCYYHDIGKVLQPGMYIENQMGGVSPHDSMTFEESADTIRQHVAGGMDLARRERLPARVLDFIPEHHGTRLVAFFYRKAAEDNPDADPDRYRYPGPRPQSRETAIVMLADSTEAVVRASDNRSDERIGELVDEVVAERVAEGQLDDSGLTLRDLRTIADSFKSTMRAVYHPRVAYPEPAPAERRRMLRFPLRPPAGGESSAPGLPRRRRP